jgi:hypothetical protein
MPIKNWSTTPASNNSSPPNGWPEGMAPSSVNDTARQQMADHRSQWENGEWFDWGDTPSRASNTTFKIAADVTSRYTKNRRIKCFDASTIYGVVTASSYSAPDTTVTVKTDSGNLSSSLTSVALAILTPTSSSLPSTVGYKGSDVASASTIDLSAAGGDFVDVTGTTTITAISSEATGVMRLARFTGALTLTHNATSLILPGGNNIVTQAGDRATFRSLGSGNWICVHFQRANGATIPFGYKGSDIASSGTTDLATATGDFVDVTGTTTITALGTAPAGYPVTVRFTGALTLTHNGTSLILPGSANITTADGDAAIFRSLGSGNWKCVSYTKQDGTPVVGGTAASQSDQETATSTSTFVSPGRQQYHPSANKCWLNVTYSGGTPTNQASYNVSSLTDTAAGKLTINLTTAFSGTRYTMVGSGGDPAASGTLPTAYYPVGARSASNPVIGWVISGAFADPIDASIQMCGDQ